MQRRTFLKKTSASGIAVATLPAITLFNEPEYSIEELMGKATIELFGKGINLREEAHDAFIKMKRAAFTAGFDVKIVSSYRSFERQKAIFERKYIKYTEIDNIPPLDAIDKIIEYSTIPGTSRHHWGTDIDIIDGYPSVSGDVLVPKKFEEGGPFEAFKKWLDENANEFGYYLVYTDDYFRKGFKYEPWHYSYRPLSKPMLEQFRGINIFRELVQEEFEGSEHFTTGFLKTYIQNNILGINKKLL